jgi:hypothetical protein
MTPEKGLVKSSGYGGDSDLVAAYMYAAAVVESVSADQLEWGAESWNAHA